MVKCTRFCLEDHLEKMDTEAFEAAFSHLSTDHPKYHDVYVTFLSFNTPEGDHCFLEDGILHLVLHVAPSTEAMIGAFERGFLGKGG